MNNGKLLVISSDAATSSLLQTTFVELGYEVDCVVDIDLAIEKIRTRIPDLILFNTDLPLSKLISRSQVAVTSPLRTAFPSLYVIWIYTVNDVRPIMGGPEYPQDDFMCKPFDIEELKYVVNTTMRAMRRAAGHVRKYRLFAISDDPNFVQGLRPHLFKHDYEFYVVSNLDEVVSFIHFLDIELRPNLVVMDFRELASAYKVSQQLHLDAICKSIPQIMISRPEHFEQGGYELFAPDDYVDRDKLSKLEQRVLTWIARTHRGESQ
jgi:CheY-like chemotaxis protein